MSDVDAALHFARTSTAAFGPRVHLTVLADAYEAVTSEASAPVRSVPVARGQIIWLGGWESSSLGTEARSFATRDELGDVHMRQAVVVEGVTGLWRAGIGYWSAPERRETVEEARADAEAHVLATWGRKP